MGIGDITTLDELMAELFNDGGLRRFVARLPQGNELMAALPGSGTPFADVVFAAAKMLERFGLVDTTLDRLVRVRPNRRGDIERVRDRILTTGAATTSDGTISIGGRGCADLCNVPRGSPYFVGRDAELKSLEQALRRSSSDYVAVSLEGLAGIGKTELAIQLVHRLYKQQVFPGGIYWFNAENPDLTTTWGHVVADELEVVEGPLAERAAFAIKKLSRSGCPLLIVLDNVESWSNEQKPHPLPQGAHVHLLVTTRHRNLAGALFEPFEVRFLHRESALRLLSKLFRHDLTVAHGIDGLLEYLGGHALAVELAGVYLGKYPFETPAKYLAYLLENASIEDEVAEKTRYGRTVNQVFMSIWNQIDDTARNAWHLAACFAPEPASYELATAVGLDKNALGILLEWHLIGDVQQDRKWTMHRLIRDFGARIGSPDDRARARQRFVERCAHYANSMDEHFGFRRYSSDRTHLDAALAVAPSLLNDDPEIVVLFQSRIALVRRVLGECAQARDLYQQVLESQLNIFGAEHPNVATTRNNFASVLQDLGELELAREQLQRSLESVLATFGPDHPRVATRRNNLASVMEEIGELEPARKMYQQALESYLVAFGPNHPTVATTRSNLAGVLKELGELEAARELYQQALESDLVTFKSNHPRVATRRNNLASILEELGELEPARELYHQALEFYLATFGPNHPTVATTRGNLAGVLKDLGELETACELYQQSLEFVLFTFGPNHPTAARRCNNLALVLKELGELKPARKLYQQALESYLATFSPDHPTVATIRSNLAGVLKELGELQAARELYQQALESDLATFASSHPRIAKRRHNLASVLKDLGELELAREQLQQSLKSALANLGPEHPKVARRRNNLALVLQDLGELEAARDQLQQSLKSVLAIFDPGHPTVAKRRHNLAVVLRNLGELELARDQLQQALESELVNFGAEHLTVARARNNLALVLQDLGEWEPARALFQQALESALTTLGPEHPEVAAIRNNFLLLLENLGGSKGLL